MEISSSPHMRNTPLNLDLSFLNKIISALGNSVSSDNETRLKAEASLKEAQHTVGYASALLKISGDKELVEKGKFEVDVALAASI